jgi:2-polyprenyl-3-methyl-5-hydroxy-6-metoxy-1,4-benzoquinol methylase
MHRMLDMLLRILLAPLAALPRRWRLRLAQLFMEREETRGSPTEALRFLFGVEDAVKQATDRAALAYGHGVHPKHRLTGYHEFFVRNINPGSRVLDVGCGSGEVAADVAARVAGSKVTALDISADSIAMATARHQLANLTFACGDVRGAIPGAPFDVVILSNVLEHIDDRPGLLRHLAQVTSARLFLLRVPLFEREASIALRKELSVPYFSDPSHKIEHTVKELRDELAAAGLRIEREEFRWGEAWVAAVPATRKGDGDA